MPNQAQQLVDAVLKEAEVAEGLDWNDPIIRRSIGSKPQRIETFKAALASPLDSIRLIAAKNPNLPVELMRMIASDSSPTALATKVGLSQNPNCPPELMAILRAGEDDQAA